MSKLYTKYLQEKEGKQTLEIDGKGFVTYKVVGNVCHICILFVAEKYRRGDIARELMNSVKQIVQYSCNAFTAAIFTKQNGTTETLRIILQYGFEVVGVKDDDILLYKEF
ncbi:MAG TPA: GNAT family N-acetyltransferase [Yeosuana sp.]